MDEEVGYGGPRKVRPHDDEFRDSDTTPPGADRQFVHSVAVPPTFNFWADVKASANEVFFADEPLRPYRHYQGKDRWKAYVLYLVPILDWLPKYTMKMFKGDLVAGLTITSLAIPQDLAYARLANLDPIYGLYSSFTPPLMYAMLGSSKHIVIGPVAVVSTLMGQMLSKEIDPEVDPKGYLRLALTATFFAGLLQAGLGLLRLGFVIDFLSHAAIVGFMTGAAITIALRQLRGISGIRTFTSKADLVSVMRSIWEHTDQLHWQTVCIGLFFLFLLLGAKKAGQMRKKLFWLSALAPLSSVILGTLFVFITRLDKKGVKVVGYIEKGVNPESFNEIFWTGDQVPGALKVGIVAGLVSLTEAVAIGRSFATLSGYRIDGNKEMLALGTMNIVGSWTSCYVTTGSFSRTAVNYQSGCKTMVSNIVMSVAVLFTLLLLTPLFRYTPDCVLAAIIITAVLSIIDTRAVYLVWKTDKVDFIVLSGAFLGVLFISVEIGLLVAVCISFTKIIFHVTRPQTALLGNIPGTNLYRNIQQYPQAVSEPGMVIVRIDASIYFTNANYILERILKYVNQMTDEVGQHGGVPVQYVLVEMAAVMAIDTAGIHVFEELNTVLQARGIQLAITNPVGRVIATFNKGCFVDVLGHEWFFLSVSEAVQVCSILIKRQQHAAN